eukprot:08437.XXX_460658_461197_1 [CDS] Oithona nana genome sequencing.
MFDGLIVDFSASMITSIASFQSLIWSSLVSMAFLSISSCIILDFSNALEKVIGSLTCIWYFSPLGIIAMEVPACLEIFFGFFGITPVLAMCLAKSLNDLGPLAKVVIGLPQTNFNKVILSFKMLQLDFFFVSIYAAIDFQFSFPIFNNLITVIVEKVLLPNVATNQKRTKNDGEAEFSG